MVRGNGVSTPVSERHQTALRGPVPAAPAEAAVTPKCDAPETSPCRTGGHSKRTARPPKGNGLGLASRRGNRDPRPALVPAPDRVGSVLIRLARRAASAHHAAVARGDSAGVCLVGVDLVHPTGHRPGANPNAMGSGVCRSATREVGPQEI